ncbi:hypothetical protein QBC35DRAFT_468329, partial [Podospora australis]
MKLTSAIRLAGLALVSASPQYTNPVEPTQSVAVRAPQDRQPPDDGSHPKYKAICYDLNVKRNPPYTWTAGHQESPIQSEGARCIHCQDQASKVQDT